MVWKKLYTIWTVSYTHLDVYKRQKDGEKLSSPVGKGFGKRRGLPSNEFYIKNEEEIKQSFRQFPDAFEAYTEFLAKFEPYTCLLYTSRCV